MAISRYSQPIQHQYIPTTPDPKLTAMMLQKRSADTAQAAEQRNVLESNVLGIKAYGEEDKTKLQEKQSQYTDRVGRIYDMYKGDSNATLSAMNELNREFQRDFRSGDLYDIDLKYKTAQTDIKDAKNRAGTGDLTEAGARQQIEQAGTGWRAQKNPDMFKTIQTQISAQNYSKDIFGGDEESARASVRGMFAEQFGTQLSYMNEEEIASAERTVDYMFYNKWRGDGRGVDDKAFGAGTAGDSINYRNLGLNNNYKSKEVFNSSRYLFDKDDNMESTNFINPEYIKEVNEQFASGNFLDNQGFRDFYKEKYDLSDKELKDLFTKARDQHKKSPFQQLKEGTIYDEANNPAKEYGAWATNAERMKEAVNAELDDYRSKYPEFDNKSDKEVMTMVNDLQAKYSSEFDAIGEIDERYEDLMPDALVQDGKFNQMIGRDMTILGGSSETFTTDGLVDELGFKDHNEFFINNKRSGRGVISSDGNIIYELTNSDGDTVMIKAPPISNSMKQTFSPSARIDEVVRSSGFGKDEYHSFDGGSPIVSVKDEDGYIVKQFQPDGFEAVPNFANSTIEYYALKKKGKSYERIIYDGEGVPIYPNELFKSSMEEYVKQRQKIKGRK